MKRYKFTNAIMAVAFLVCINSPRIACQNTPETKHVSKCISEVVNTEKSTVTVLSFWSRSCPPCVNELGRIDSLAGLNTKLKFIWYEVGNKMLTKYSSEYTHITFINDEDSALWKCIKPSAWGVCIAVASDSEQIWKGYTYQLTQSLLSRLGAKHKIEDRISRANFCISIEQDTVLLEESSFSLYESDSGDRIVIVSEPLTTLYTYVLREIYGSRSVVRHINDQCGLIPLNVDIAVHWINNEKRLAYEQLLEALNSVFNIVLSVEDMDKAHQQTSISIDYSACCANRHD